MDNIKKSLIWWKALSEDEQQSVMFKFGFNHETLTDSQIEDLFFMEISTVPEMRRSNIDYFKVKEIAGVCLKGISCNLCDFIDRDAGKLNNCIVKYYETYHTKKL